MCSFGKDSLVLLDLAVPMGVRDVLYLENIDELVDPVYQARIVESYGLRFKLLPKGRGLLFFVNGTAQFFCFPFVSATTMLPVPMGLSPWNGELAFMCVDDELRATHGPVVDYDFDVLFFGQKRVDLLDGGGTCLPWFPQLSEHAQREYHARLTPRGPQWRLGYLNACSPLYDWAQDDVWDYIEQKKLPVSPIIYDGRKRRLHQNVACYRCHDPNLPAKVFCPKLEKEITNLGALSPQGPERLVPLGLLNEAELADLAREK